MLKKEARKITGGLSKPSKMPGPAYNLPAWVCQTGQKLAKIEGTPCYGCYALNRGRYNFSNVKAALQRRLEALESPLWVEAMATLIKGQPWFRWHDSGDIQSAQHLKNIFEVCKLTPETKHWLPTQERQYLPDLEAVPDNLIIRLSGSKVDGPAPKAWPWTSSVVTSAETRTCPAPEQGNECGSCRACWDKSTPNVAYGKH
jgi:hypothetical protein